jgi:hypothetical protein
MAKANPLWDAPELHGELLMLGFVLSERSVSRYMPKPPRKPPSQTWRTFLGSDLKKRRPVDPDKRGLWPMEVPGIARFSRCPRSRPPRSIHDHSA